LFLKQRFSSFLVLSRVDLLLHTSPFFLRELPFISLGASRLFSSGIDFFFLPLGEFLSFPQLASFPPGRGMLSSLWPLLCFFEVPASGFSKPTPLDIPLKALMFFHRT